MAGQLTEPDVSAARPARPVRLYRSVSRASSSSATIPVGPRRLAQRHRAADRDDRRIGQFQQPIIELENGAPVGPAAIRRAQCTDCTARFELEPPDPAQVAERVRLHWAIKTKITRLFLEIGQYTQNGAVDSTRWVSQMSIQSA